MDFITIAIVETVVILCITILTGCGAKEIILLIMQI